ncbi:hypothetical protein [Methylomagnum sp.]
MPQTTKVSVRALAYGGKFIGKPVGFAQIDIYDPKHPDKPLASGITEQRLAPDTDGSGVTPLIMGQPYPWGHPVRDELATEFTADLALTEPTLLTFVATTRQEPKVFVTCQRLVIPQAPLTGAMAVVMVVPGLLVGLAAPTANSAEGIVPGVPTQITAQVRMMCGCLIENLFWPAANFNVHALISDGGKTVNLPLSYNGQPSFFSAPHTFHSYGPHEISVIATEMNGNTGATVPLTVDIKRH